MSWSERIDYYPAFVVVPPRRWANLVFSLVWPIAAFRGFRIARQTQSGRGFA
jgi:hypothetical protein